jgi:SAM-dependent methyltransferase
VGIDPSLGAIKAAQRVARELGVNANFIVADARFLPFRDRTFDSIYSYSVIQHFSRDDAAKVAAEIGRALKLGGRATIQMPTRYGLRCLYHQARRRFREANGFEVRYWRLRELKRLFESTVGSTDFSADCFFGIGLQKSDLGLMPPSLRAVTRASEALKSMTHTVPALVHAADSVFVRAIRTRDARERNGCSQRS